MTDLTSPADSPYQGQRYLRTNLDDIRDELMAGVSGVSVFFEEELQCNISTVFSVSLRSTSTAPAILKVYDPTKAYGLREQLEIPEWTPLRDEIRSTHMKYLQGGETFPSRKEANEALNGRFDASRYIESEAGTSVEEKDRERYLQNCQIAEEERYIQHIVPETYKKELHNYQDNTIHQGSILPYLYGPVILENGSRGLLIEKIEGRDLSRLLEELDFQKLFAAMLETLVAISYLSDRQEESQKIYTHDDLRAANVIVYDDERGPSRRRYRHLEVSSSFRPQSQTLQTGQNINKSVQDLSSEKDVYVVLIDVEGLVGRTDGRVMLPDAMEFLREDVSNSLADLGWRTEAQPRFQHGEFAPDCGYGGLSRFRETILSPFSFHTSHQSTPGPQQRRDFIRLHTEFYVIMNKTRNSRGPGLPFDISDAALAWSLLTSFSEDDLRGILVRYLDSTNVSFPASWREATSPRRSDWSELQIEKLRTSLAIETSSDTIVLASKAFYGHEAPVLVTLPSRKAKLVSESGETRSIVIPPLRELLRVTAED